MTRDRRAVERARTRFRARRKAVEAIALDLADDLRGDEPFGTILLRFSRAMDAAGVTVAMLDAHARKRGQS